MIVEEIRLSNCSYFLTATESQQLPESKIINNNVKLSNPRNRDNNITYKTNVFYTAGKQYAIKPKFYL